MCMGNLTRSPVFDLMLTATKFCLEGYVKDFVEKC